MRALLGRRFRCDERSTLGADAEASAACVVTLHNANAAGGSGAAACADEDERSVVSAHAAAAAARAEARTSACGRRAARVGVGVWRRRRRHGRVRRAVATVAARKLRNLVAAAARGHAASVTAAATPGGAVAGVAGREPLDDDERAVIAARVLGAVDDLRERHGRTDGGAAETAVQTAARYIDNVLAHPDLEKYRKVSVGNKVFKKRIGDVDGGFELMRACGFVESGSKLFLELPPPLDTRGGMHALSLVLDVLHGGRGDAAAAGAFGRIAAGAEEEGKSEADAPRRRRICSSSSTRRPCSRSSPPLSGAARSTRPRTSTRRA